MSEIDVIGVVLAAGRGRRLGGPKALLAWREGGRVIPLAAAHARAWAFCQRVVIVTRSDIAEMLRKHAPTMRAELLVSQADDALGPAGSLMAAAATLAAGSHVLLTPVDCPPVAASTAHALVAALAPPEVVAARPRYKTRRGHPVALTEAVWGKYRQQAAPLRDVLSDFGPRVVEVAVDDPGVLRDVDRPEDLHAPPTFFNGGSSSP